MIYSCTGRAANKTPEDGIEHMASELERQVSHQRHLVFRVGLCSRLFKNSTLPGSIAWFLADFQQLGKWAVWTAATCESLVVVKSTKAWIVDFAGFGFADCNPKIGVGVPAEKICRRYLV